MHKHETIPETSSGSSFYTDLHVHSNCSDGTCTPEEVVVLAIDLGLKGIALTDHDSVSGIQRAREEAARRDPAFTVIPGIELSCAWKNTEIHMLGLDIDPEHPAINAYLDEFLRERDARNALMLEKLASVGCIITMQELKEHFPNSILGRPHYARLMMEKGFVTSINAAFNQYLGDHGPCYVPRRKADVMDAIDVIRKSGGRPVLAHPMQYGFSRDLLESFVNLLSEHGLEGMECLYSRYTNTDSDRLIRMAKRHGLFVTGGSDFHGANKPEIRLGTGVNNGLRVPWQLALQAGLVHNT